MYSEKPRQEVKRRTKRRKVRRGRYNKALLYSDPAVAKALVMKTEQQVYDKYKTFRKIYRETFLK